MRLVGLVLVAVGFLGGALFAVLDPATVPLAWFVPSVVLGAVGVGLVRFAGHREAHDTSRVEANFKALDVSLGRIAGNVAKLDDEKADMDVYALPERIDELFLEDIAAFVEARESIAHVWGSQAYADVMSPFAAAERYLNRVWSTAADGYVDEAHEYLGRSRAQFADALARLEALRDRRDS